jgi:hypothetical protein
MQISSATASTTTPVPSLSPAAAPTRAPTTVQSSQPVQSSQAEAASAVLQSLADSTYSTSVGGKSYSGNVSQANGLYEISVPNLPGSAVSASSLQAAENALNARIDLLA